MVAPEDALASLAATADGALESCRARADALRARLSSLRLDFVGASDDVDAVATFDARLASCDDRPASFAGALERCEAHLARGEHGRALAAYLTLARAAAVSGPGRAYRSLTPAILSRAERCRRPLAERFRRDLADTLRSYAAAAASVGSRVNPHENQRAALALGACFWLANDLERSSDVRPGWRPVESVLAEHVEAVERDVTRAFARHPRRTTQAAADDDDASVLLSAVLDALAAAAEWQTALAAAIPEHPPSSTLARLYAEPAARAAGRALDATLHTLARNGDGSNPDDVSNPRAFDRALRVVGRCRAACDRYCDESLPRAYVAGWTSRPWRPALSPAPSAASEARVALEAAFASRRDRLERELIRRALPATAALRRRASDATLAVVNAGATSAEAEAEASAATSTSAPTKYEPACARVIAELVDAASSVEARLPAGAPERAAASRAMNAAGRVVADVVAAALAGEKRTSLEAACVARNVAAAAARAARRSEAAARAGTRRGSSHDERSSSSSSSFSSDAAVVAAAEDARAVAESLESLAASAESRAVAASLRTPGTALEGAAAQTWTHHRAPERIKRTPMCSPHLLTWRAALRRASRALERHLAADPNADPKSSRRNATKPTAARALADRAAAEAWGVYSRLAPSRAWRDRFAWDCRTMARTLRALDERARKTEASTEDEENQRRRKFTRRRQETRRRPTEANDEANDEANEDDAEEERETRDGATRDDDDDDDDDDEDAGIGSCAFRASTCARMARAMCERAALLTVPTETILDAVVDVRAAAASGMVPVRFSQKKPPKNGQDETPGDAEDARADENAADGDVPFAARGHPWGLGHATPEAGWRDSDAFDPLGSDSDSDPWDWFPARERERDDFAVEDPWPSPQVDAEAHEAARAAWAEVESRLASTASVASMTSAMWRRSELAEGDATPLEEGERASRAALVDAVEKARGAVGAAEEGWSW